VALDQRESIQKIWREHFAGLWVSPAVGGYIGVLVALLSREIGAGAVLTVLPMPVIVYQMLRTSLARTDDQVRHLEAMNRTYASTIEAFATAVDAKDQVTHGHLRRVQVYALGVARELGITDEPTVRSLEAAALLHDVGKIGIPEHILNKPGKLTAGEFEEMKRHVTIGADILSAIDFPFPVVPIVRHHHENWDGTGYPDGVGGTDIPIGARILMVVDCFDALTSDRPYRPAMSRADAFAILRERRGRMYDPDIVDRFIEIQPRLSETLGLESHVAPAELHVAMRSGSRARITAVTGGQAASESLARLLGDVLSDCLAVIYEMDSTGSSVVAKAARGWAARKVIGHRLTVGQGVSGWACANNHAIDDTDAALDLAGVLPAAEIAGLSCTSVPMGVAGRRIVVTVYGPRSGTAQRVALIHGLNQYLQTAAQPESKSAPAALAAVGMARAS
jgi:putative nucleotidyltransferase with HDIG domain